MTTGRILRGPWIQVGDRALEEAASAEAASEDIAGDAPGHDAASLASSGDVASAGAPWKAHTLIGPDEVKYRSAEWFTRARATLHGATAVKENQVGSHPAAEAAAQIQTAPDVARDADPAPAAVEVVTSAPADFDASCAAIRARLRETEGYLVRELFAISDLIAEAEKLFDPATPVTMPPGTRYGKLVHVMAERLGRSPAWVEKLRRLAKIDHASRVLAEDQADGSLRMLLDIAAEPDIALRIRALNARATQGPRKTAMQKLLVGAGHPLHHVASIFLNKAEPLANVPPATTLPETLVVRFPELTPYATVGDVRAALRGPGTPPLAVPQQSVNGGAPECATPVRTIRLPRDKSVVEGMRVVSVTCDEVVIEVQDASAPPQGEQSPSSVPASAPPGPTGAGDPTEPTCVDGRDWGQTVAVTDARRDPHGVDMRATRQTSSTSDAAVEVDYVGGAVVVDDLPTSGDASTPPMSCEATPEARQHAFPPSPRSAVSPPSSSGVTTITELHLALWRQPATDVQRRLYEANLRGYFGGVEEGQIDAVLSVLFLIAYVRPTDTPLVLAPTSVHAAVTARVKVAYNNVRGTEFAPRIFQTISAMRVAMPATWAGTPPRVWVSLGFAGTNDEPAWLTKMLTATAAPNARDPLEIIDIADPSPTVALLVQAAYAEPAVSSTSVVDAIEPVPEALPLAPRKLESEALEPDRAPLHFEPEPQTLPDARDASRAGGGVDPPSLSASSLPAEFGSGECDENVAVVRAMPEACRGCGQTLACDPATIHPNAAPLLCFKCYLRVELPWLENVGVPFGGRSLAEADSVLESNPKRPETNRPEPPLLEPDPERRPLVSSMTPADAAGGETPIGQRAGEVSADAVAEHARAANLWTQIESVLATEAKDFEGTWLGPTEAAEWRRSMIAELRVAVAAASLTPSPGTAKLTVTTLRRKLRDAEIDVPKRGPIDCRRWRRLVAQTCGTQYDQLLATWPLVAAFNAAVGYPERTSRCAFRVPYLSAVFTLLTTTPTIGEAVRARLHQPAADILRNAHAQLGRLRKQERERGSWGSTRSSVSIDDACATLGLTVPAWGQPVDPTVLQRAYKKRAAACHPDRHGGSPERGAELTRLNGARAEILAYNEKLAGTE